MYQASTPETTWEQVKKRHKDDKTGDWLKKYTIPRAKYEGIHNKYGKRVLSKLDKITFAMQILNYSPTMEKDYASTKRE